MQEQIDEINTRLDSNDESLQEFSDNLDSSITDIQTSIDEQATSIDDLTNNEGQLIFPLSQDTIDLISEQGPSIMQEYKTLGFIGTIQLSGGTATLTSPNITTSSIIFYNVKTFAGVAQITAGGLPMNHLSYSYTVSNGSATFTSSISSDTSTLSYLII